MYIEKTKMDMKEATPNKEKKSRRSNSKGKDRRRASHVTSVEVEKEALTSKGMSNDPSWYFQDKALADQVTQLSFQQVAGRPIELSGIEWDVPNIVRINLNPCPGVTLNKDFANPSLTQMVGINLAGFRLFSKLSAYTGRVATYAPQDISTMILAFGEVISMMEFVRRAFGVANTYNMRNRDYPKNALAFGMKIDPDDFFSHFANYRTRFNALVTMVNQLPIPKGIAYFDKCAAIYERIFLDDNSSMAQSLITAPFSTWIIDETSDPNGTKLVTVPVIAADRDDTRVYLDQPVSTPRPLSYYLDVLDSQIGALLNSSTLQVVYTDLLNLANKVGQEFWKLDYLMDGYQVVPEFNLGFSLQMHNATIVGPPTNNQVLTVYHITDWNDVIPNPNGNVLYYNPGFNTLGDVENGLVRTGTNVLIDMLTDSPTVEERVDVTRYTSIGGLNRYNKVRDGVPTPNSGLFDATLPDHYVVSVSFETQDATKQAVADNCASSIARRTQFIQYGAYTSVIDWAPRLYEGNDASTGLTGLYFGDLNYYTTVDIDYLRRLHQFVTLGLYDLR